MNKNSSAQPDLTSVLDELKRTILRDINCVKLGSIDSYDKDSQTATVKLTVKVLVSSDGDTKTYNERPILLEVPTIMLSGGDSYLSFPISDGDDCLVFFNDRDIENWYISGGVSTPNTPRMHDLSDGFALVGVSSLQNLFSSMEDDRVKLRFNETNKLEIKDGEITLTSTLTKIFGLLETTGHAKFPTAEVTAGATGVFTTVDGKTVTVVKGIVTLIV